MGLARDRWLGALCFSPENSITMKEKIKKYWWIVLIVFVVGIMFWWFQLRPSYICSFCSKEAKRMTNNNVTSQRYEIYYEACLRDHGLKK